MIKQALSYYVLFNKKFFKNFAVLLTDKWSNLIRIAYCRVWYLFWKNIVLFIYNYTGCLQ